MQKIDSAVIIAVDDTSVPENELANSARMRIALNLARLIDNLMALADGVMVQEISRDGSPRVYCRPPDRQANEYLLNRLLGRPAAKSSDGVSDLHGLRIRPDLDLSLVPDDQLEQLERRILELCHEYHHEAGQEQERRPGAGGAGAAQPQ